MHVSGGSAGGQTGNASGAPLDPRAPERPRSALDPAVAFPALVARARSAARLGALDRGHDGRASGEAPRDASRRAPAEAGAGDPDGSRAAGSPTARDERDRQAAPPEELAPASLEPLDPATRHLAHLAPPLAPPPPAPGTSAPPTLPRSLEELLPQLVRRIAWAGDGRRGSVRMELGAGVFAGASVVVHADGPRVRVELSGLPDAELVALGARLDRRLRGHGLDVEAVV